MTKKAHVTNIALLTNCTVSGNFSPLMNIADAPEVQTMQELCDWWVDAMKEVWKQDPKALHTPGEIYNGVSYDTIPAIAELIGHKNIFVINRGAGLVGFQDKMIPYNFTYNRDEADSAWNKVTGEKFIPYLWWRMINQGLYGTDAPITSRLSGYAHIVTALPQGFIRLIAQDLAQMPNIRERLFMPLPQSSIFNIPRDLREGCIPYAMAYAQDLSYNKFSKSQVVAHKFLTVGLESGGLIKHANALREAQNALSGATDAMVDYEQMFTNNPELLTAIDGEAAFQRAKMKGLRIGSRPKFHGAWKGAQGIQIIEVTKTELNTATEALRTIMSGGMGQSHSTDEELLKQVGIFIAAVKAEDPTLPFTAKNVAAWGKLVYNPEEKRPMPSIARATKTAGMLRTYTAYLGLETVIIGTTKAYRIKS